MNYLPIFTYCYGLHDLCVLMIAVQFDYLCIDPVFAEIIANSKINVFSDPTWDYTCKHSIIKAFDFGLFKASINQDIFWWSIWSNPDIIQSKSLGKCSEMTLYSITLENYKVVAFSCLYDLLEKMEVIIFRGEIENLIIPNYFCFGSLKFDSLTDCILEVKD